MDNTVSIIFTQIIIMFFLICAGQVAVRLKLVSGDTPRQMSSLLVYFVVPVVMVVAFQTDYDPDSAMNLLYGILIGVAVHLLAIGISQLVFRKGTERNRILRYGVVYSNCGFMCLPLLSAALGQTGVFLGSAYIVSLNIFVWIHGVYMISGDRSRISVRKALLSPGVIGAVCALALYLLKLRLPPIAIEGLTHLANLNTPVAMLIIGMQLDFSTLGGLLKTPAILRAIAVRLLVMPLIVMTAIYFLPVAHELKLTVLIQSAAPVAANTTLFATMFRKDHALASGYVTLSTLLALATMPLVILLFE